jgi:DUF4097 and DUF4098 domain-containing protein YvlB
MEGQFSKRFVSLQRYQLVVSNNTDLDIGLNKTVLGRTDRTTRHSRKGFSTLNKQYKVLGFILNKTEVYI